MNGCQEAFNIPITNKYSWPKPGARISGVFRTLVAGCWNPLESVVPSEPFLFFLPMMTLLLISPRFIPTQRLRKFSEPKPGQHHAAPGLQNTLIDPIGRPPTRGLEEGNEPIRNMEHSTAPTGIASALN
jgi:hypothetical protein